MTVKHRTPKFGYKKRQTPWTDAPMNPCEVQVQLEKYMAMVQEKNEQYYKICGFTHSDPDHISADMGRKYARIVKNDQLSGSRSVHTFVNMLNGDILKAGGWSAPQKNGVRGNIFADDLGANRVNEHGANYLK